ncbi:c-type cytochrome [Salinimicrobium xinjiangense]|uniref:c-type cytochrome n=1 Tax=Salinimicrobium xinjiangense TaxID=438596 RepID=UPI00040F8F43|nr:cytochrome c [Salinimicrobium xinjiangense]
MRKSLLGLFLVLSFGCKNSSEENTSAITKKEITPEFKESISRGAGLYNNFCASCHLAGGEGIQGVFPPVKDSDWLKNKQKESIHAVKFGLKGPIKVNGVEYDNLMPALGLSNQEIADIMNYINNAWGNNFGETLTEEDVAAIEK